ncbi:MAG: OB-fold domain-containing protein, partial [Sphingomonadales bacterium]|nr:OB-fold domain-containing protein [Sphingomonadales bacterium]
EWARMSGHGTVLAHLVFHRAYHPGRAEDVPYSVILVQLREGPRMFSNLVDPDHRYVDQDLVGRDVSVVFDDIGDGLSLPRFAVSPSPPANDDPAAE